MSIELSLPMTPLAIREESSSLDEESRAQPRPDETTAHPQDPTRPCLGPFTNRPDGIWYARSRRPQADGTVPFLPPELICGPLQILGYTRTLESSNWGLRVRFFDPDEKVHEETIPKELLVRDGSELTRILTRSGLFVPPEESKRRKLVSYLASISPKSRAVVVDRVGWNGSVFVLPKECFGEIASGEKVYLELEQDDAFQVSGTLGDWQDEVAVHAKGNSRLVFSIAAGFAPPLLGPLGIESGGIHFYGDSSKGKSIYIFAAGSIWGGPIYHSTWRASLSGLEACALAHNDCLLTIDEQGQGLPKEAGDVAYLLANGQDKLRAKRTLDGHPRRRWRLLFLSTGEVKLADIQREEGREAKAGQEVRLVDVPATPDGLDQNFECISGFGNSKDFAEHLRKATSTYYGSAARAFLSRLVQMTPEEIRRLGDRKDEWARAHVPKGSDSQVARVVDRFAVISVAGELAIEWGIVPWGPGESSWAAEVCLRAWLHQRGGIRSLEFQNGIMAVLGFLQRHGTSRFAAWEHKTEKVANCAGLWRKNGDCIDYYFSSEGWKDACRGFNPTVVVKACVQAGLLVPVTESGKQRYQENVKVERNTERYYIIRGRGIDEFNTQEAQFGF